MPIYEYRCGKCGFQKEFLQRLSDAPLTVCPECGKRALTKLVSAAGFQLKGTGWYATDFKTSNAKPAAKSDKPVAKSDKPADGAKPADSGSKEATKSDASSGSGASPAST